MPRASTASPTEADGATAFPCLHSLCAPAGGVYTDGSCIKNAAGGQSVGAGIYATKNHFTLMVNPAGKAYTNTINRAELSAIHQALMHPSVASAEETIHLYTDSLCSIYMIRRILDAPWTLKESKHYKLLHNILNALRARAEAGGMTYIYKVKSHSGIRGNDKADEKAKEAADKVAEGLGETLTTESSSNEPYDERTWVCTESPVQPEQDDLERDSTPNYVSSLLDGIKR